LLLLLVLACCNALRYPELRSAEKTRWMIDADFGLSLMGKVAINRKRRPTHPGAILREDILPAAGINQTQLADLIGVPKRTVHEVVQERRPIRDDMARRLSGMFGNSLSSGSSCSKP
jgi:addiction module HigA family antidote